MLSAAISTVLSLDNLAPSPRVNTAFGVLVDAVVRTDEYQSDSSLEQQVRAVASQSETELEVAWARRIIASSDPAAELAAFPYADNYQELVRREIALVEDTGLPLGENSRVCMIGTGPLPMTALELTRQRGVQIDHVDISRRALALCALVGSRLGLACGHIDGDGATVRYEQQYDAIIVAGLAGDTAAAKQAIIDNALPALARGGRIVVRSAWGARSLLYPAVKARQFTGVNLLREYHPHDTIINSVFIYEQA